MEAYGLSIIGLLLVCLIPIVLANVVGPLKGKSGLVGGPVPDARDENLVFRMDRSHGNSVESIPVFVAPAILAMLAGVGPGYLALLIWVFLAIRLLYVIIYLRGGPLAKGGNLRTVIHVLGSVVTLVLMVSVAVHVI